MTLPTALQQAIENLTSGFSLSSLTAATQEVSGRYRNPNQLSKAPALTSDQHRLSYLITRLPATFEAIHAVLTELTKRAPTFIPKNLLDVGAGPGTGLWAASNVFSSLTQATLIEQDSAFLSIGKQLAEELPSATQWIQDNMTKRDSYPGHDLVLLSYSIGEIEPAAALDVLKACWEATQQAMIVIEPGTPRGYETILRARRALVEWGGHLIAPCPQSGKCPMEGTKDWCHFSARVARTSFHRQAKAGALGHEDEKFSYIIVTKGAGQPVTERVVRHPLARSGHVHLELCTPDGIKKTVVSKKQGDSYRWAKKAEWGDSR